MVLWRTGAQRSRGVGWMEHRQHFSGGVGTPLLPRSDPDGHWCAAKSGILFCLALPYLSFSRLRAGSLPCGLGSLRGNVILGVGLHYTRLFVCLQIFPLLPDHAATYTVLLAWAVTEVARYPFYIAPSSITTTVRYACPVFTFPIGAGVLNTDVAYLSCHTTTNCGCLRHDLRATPVGTTYKLRVSL